MTDSGYVGHLPYLHGYYVEMSPARARFALLANGYSMPALGTACELGYGQGVSLNVHAAASPAQWWGTDFNAGQAAFAQELQGASGVNALLADQPFTEFCSRSDLPDFDFIALHGIWSWVSEENRQVIVDFLRRKLRVGGLVYVSYNTLPGWSGFAPLRHLLAEHRQTLSPPGIGTAAQIDQALAFAHRLLNTDPLYLKAHPYLKERLEAIGRQNRIYLAHEYFNRNWQPMAFASVAEALEPAKLDFVGSAWLLDAVDVLNLTEQQQRFLAEIPDSRLQQTARDLMVNQQFRRDYWMKGCRRLPVLEQMELLRGSSVVLQTRPEDIERKLSLPTGQADLSPAIYNPILEALADFSPRTIGWLEDKLRAANITLPQLLQALIVLMGKGDLAPAQEEDAIANARGRTGALNARLMRKARTGDEVQFLASPLTGGGVPVDRFAQLFALMVVENAARKDGVSLGARALAEGVWQLLTAQGQGLMKEGKRLERNEDALAELTRQATAFLHGQLPILRALQII